MALKRFLIFAFDPAAAAGGWRDFKGDAETREEAEKLAEKLYGRIQIVDTALDDGASEHLISSQYRDFEYETQ